VWLEEAETIAVTGNCRECGAKWERDLPCPLAKDAKILCKGCMKKAFNTPRGRRKQRGIVQAAKNAALAVRVKPFLTLPLEGHEREWFELAHELRVDSVALEALVAVVQRGGWKSSTAPFLYLRKTVERQAEEWQDPFSETGRLKQPQIFSTIPISRAERNDAKCRANYRDLIAQPTRDDVDKAQATLRVVADPYERDVICARAQGITREDFLSGVSGEERLRRQAAWRRLSRKGGPPIELRDALRNASDGNFIGRPGVNHVWLEMMEDGLGEGGDYGCGGGTHTKAARVDDTEESWTDRARRDHSR
jgi:hypothetical protein